MALRDRVQVCKLDIHTDERGRFCSILDGSRLEKLRDLPFGTLIITTAYPNHVKGNHYHRSTRDWVCVVTGEGLLRLEDVQTSETIDLKMGESNFVIVEIPTGVSHGIKNVGVGEMIVVEYSDRSFEEKRNDIHPFVVIQ